jgi:hypothetical protein
MSRSGYTDDYDELFPNEGALYSSTVTNAIYGRRGQKFLRDLIAALDALPEKKLISDALVREGEVCALGAVAVARGIDTKDLDPENPRAVASVFGISTALAREIAFENDEMTLYSHHVEETPEAKWQRMRWWAYSHLKDTTGIAPCEKVLRR